MADAVAYRILLADKIPASGLAPLESGFELVEATGLDDDELRDVLAGVDGVIVRSSTTLTREVLADTDRLKVIGRAGVGAVGQHGQRRRADHGADAGGDAESPRS